MKKEEIYEQMLNEAAKQAEIGEYKVSIYDRYSVITEQNYKNARFGPEYPERYPGQIANSLRIDYKLFHHTSGKTEFSYDRNILYDVETGVVLNMKGNLKVEEAIPMIVREIKEELDAIEAAVDEELGIK